MACLPRRPTWGRVPANGVGDPLSPASFLDIRGCRATASVRIAPCLASPCVALDPGQVEFPAFYDHCYPSALERAFYDVGFRRVDARVEYVSTSYDWPVLPLFLLVAAYERLVRKADVCSLAAYVMVYAER